MNPTHWFENSICVFGQSTGVIAAGLMLLRMVDPEAQTPVPAAFGYKQLIHATFMVRLCACLQKRRLLLTLGACCVRVCFVPLSCCLAAQGGGFVTAFWVPLQGAIGLWPTTAITAGMTLAVILVWFFVLRPEFPAVREEWQQEQERRAQRSEQRSEQQRSEQLQVGSSGPMAAEVVLLDAKSTDSSLSAPLMPQQPAEAASI